MCNFVSTAYLLTAQTQTWIADGVNARQLFEMAVNAAHHCLWGGSLFIVTDDSRVTSAERHMFVSDKGLATTRDTLHVIFRTTFTILQSQRLVQSIQYQIPPIAWHRYSSLTPLQTRNEATDVHDTSKSL